MKTRRAFLLALALALVAVACGDSGGDTTEATSAAAPTSTAAPATTTAPATTAAPTTTMGSTATTEGTTGPSGDAIEIFVVTQGDRFDTKEIVVTAGQEVTITVDDRDTETDEPHNFHVRAGDFNIFTMIEEAPNTQTITFTIDTPGVYEFFCDTHAETMFGTFIVEEDM